MTLSEMIVKAIKLTNNYSNNGQLVSPTSGNYQDYVLRMRDLANDAQLEIAKYIKIPAVYSFTQYPVQNLLGRHAGFDMEQYTGTEKVYAACGAKSYYFEVDKPCTVYIEEEINGAWTELKRIDVTGINKFTGYKGNLSLSNDNNAVRMRFTGDYPFMIRHRALFPHNFPTDDEVPVYKSYVPYELPDDYMELDKVYRWYDQRQYQVIPGDYKLTGKKTIEINWFLTGQFDVHYFRLPTVIDDNTPDDYEFEVDLQAQHIIPYYVGALVIMDENQAIGSVLLQQYQNRLANLSGLTVISSVGEIADVKNW